MLDKFLCLYESLFSGHKLEKTVAVFCVRCYAKKFINEDYMLMVNVFAQFMNVHQRPQSYKMV